MKTNSRNLFITFFMGTALLVGCNASDEAKVENEEATEEVSAPIEEKQEVEATTTNQEDVKADISEPTPKEVPEDAHCAFCNMVVYGKDHEMGAFSAQAVDSHGEHLYFDDSGCVLNYERKTGEHLEVAWVRDYLTKEWVDIEQATIVKSSMKTPMKYGYSFFSSEEDANSFIQEHTDLSPELVTLDHVDNISNERYQMKMKKMQQNQNNTMDHGTMNNEDRNSEDTNNNMK